MKRNHSQKTPHGSKIASFLNEISESRNLIKSCDEKIPYNLEFPDNFLRNNLDNIK